MAATIDGVFVTLDCADPARLGKFWAALLDGMVVSRSPSIVVALSSVVDVAMVAVEHYVPPTWPDDAVPKQLHLDIATRDIEAPPAEAERLGARRAATQPQPRTSWCSSTRPGTRSASRTRSRPTRSRLGHRRVPSADTTRETPGMSVVKINAIAVPPGAGPELEKRFAARARSVEQMPGFEDFQLLRPVAGEERYFVYTRWDSEESFQNWVNSQEFHHGHARAESPDGKAVSTGAHLLAFEVVQHVTKQDVAAG